MGLTGMNIIK